MTDANRSLADQRAGGRRGASIGEGSARLKRDHRLAKLKRIMIAVALIVLGAMAAGLVVGGLGFEGLFLTVLAMIVAVGTLAVFPRITVPTRENLARGDLRQTVARTELWLESQRRALPAPAATLVDRMGVQLDGLGEQLGQLNEQGQPAGEIRRLVAEHLPEVISSYRAIPAFLRSESRAGGTPDAQLTEALGQISGEIDRVTRQLAEGALDNLAVRSRFLDYRYGAGENVSALPHAGAGDVSAADASLPYARVPSSLKPARLPAPGLPPPSLSPPTLPQAGVSLGDPRAKTPAPRTSARPPGSPTTKET